MVTDVELSQQDDKNSVPSQNVSPDTKRARIGSCHTSPQNKQAPMIPRSLPMLRTRNAIEEMQHPGNSDPDGLVQINVMEGATRIKAPPSLPQMDPWSEQMPEISRPFTDGETTQQTWQSQNSMIPEDLVDQNNNSSSLRRGQLFLVAETLSSIHESQRKPGSLSNEASCDAVPSTIFLDDGALSEEDDFSDDELDELSAEEMDESHQQPEVTDPWLANKEWLSAMPPLRDAQQAKSTGNVTPLSHPKKAKRQGQKHSNPQQQALTPTSVLTLATPASSKQRKFTKSEDEVILNAYARLGPNWEQIIQMTGLDRTAMQVRRRFKRIRAAHSQQHLQSNPNLSMDILSAQASQVASPLRHVTSNTATNVSVTASTNAPSNFVLRQTPQTGRRIEDYFSKTRPTPADEVWQMRFQQLNDLLKTETVQRQEAQKRAEEAELAVKTLREELQSMRESHREELDRKDEEASNRLEQVQAALKQTLIQYADLVAAEARRRTAENVWRLGSLRMERGATEEQREFVEDGAALLDIRKRQAECQQEKKDLEEKKRHLQTKRRQQTKEDYTLASEDLHAAEESIRFQLAALKKEELELQAQLEKLHREQRLHFRELRLQRDESLSRFNQHIVLDQRYLLLSLVGKGGFSEVYRAWDLKTSRMVACKLHQLVASWPMARRASYLRRALREAAIHRQLSHPNIVPLYDVFKIDDASFCTVLAYCDGMDLEHYSHVHGPMAERDARAVVLQLMASLRYLSQHDPPIIHYDLKPANLLLDKGVIRLTDFGLSKIVPNGPGSAVDAVGDEQQQSGVELTSVGFGTFWYLPPECFTSHGETTRISNKVDVFSTGVVFYQLLFGRKPFGHDVSQRTFWYEAPQHHSQSLTFPSRPVVSEEAKEFVKRLLEPCAALRPDVMQVCQDPYLRPKS